jgi:hypothetical protein
MLLVGATWIGLISPYWPDAITFITILFLGVELDILLYLFIATFFVAPTHVTWMTAFTDFKYKDKQKLILILIFIEAILYEVILLYFFIVSPLLLGTRLGPFYYRFADFIIFYLIFSIALLLITGIIFARETIKSPDKTIKLKGIFLLIAFISFTIGTVLDSAFELTEVTLVIARIFVIIAAFSFYMGFVLPNFVKKLILKKE